MHVEEYSVVGGYRYCFRVNPLGLVSPFLFSCSPRLLGPQGSQLRDLCFQEVGSLFEVFFTIDDGLICFNPLTIEASY